MDAMNQSLQCSLDMGELQLQVHVAMYCPSGLLATQQVKGLYAATACHK